MVNNELLEMARVYHVPFKRVITKIYFPTIRTPFLTLIGASFSFALKITVSSEVVSGALKSLGGIISLAQNVYLSPSLVVAVTLWTVLSGLVVEIAITFVVGIVDRRSVI
jgi:NitT/TauT family transport system permease protein